MSECIYIVCFRQLIHVFSLISVIKEVNSLKYTNQSSFTQELNALFDCTMSSLMC